MLARSLVVALFCANSALAASPTIRAISPTGAQRGTEIEITLAGERLADGKELLWYSPGLTVKEFVADPGNFVKAKIAIAADCPLGLHGVRVRTATGISNLLTFSVGALPEVAEVEPNTEFDKPQKIALGSTVSGVIENEDVDYFSFEAKQGQRVNLEIEGLRLGYSFFDPYIAVLDLGRFELARSDDASIARQDGACAFVAPADGTYVAMVRESAFRGDGNCKYRLHVGTFPRPTSVIPYGGKPGETLSVRWLGDLLGERTEQITLPGAAARSFALPAKDDAGCAPIATPFVLKDLPSVLEVEPNGSPQEGTPITTPAAAHGVIQAKGDIDYFKFAATKGQVLDVRVKARQLGSPLDAIVDVFRVGAGHIGGNDDNAGSPDSYLRITIPEDGEYAVHVRDHLLGGGADYAYRVEVAPPAPKFTMSLPEQALFVNTTVPVPRGNRMAIMVGADREDFGGDVQLELKDRPPGVAVEVGGPAASAAPVIPGNRPSVPVLITAAADAAPVGKLIDIVGRSTDPAVPLESHLMQRTVLVVGDNQRDVWHFDTERMALAVTDESPFAIEIVEPKCPLVRNGAMNLKVIAHRKEGFTAPIALRFLYAPPGVGVNNSIVIAEGQNEAFVPITADGGAEINTWKIAILGEAAVGGGPLVVSSQLAKLEVAEPFVAFAFQAASVEQGQATDIVIKVEKRKDWEGPAKVELLGTPHEVTADVKEITKDATELIFPLKTTANSPAGQHNTLFCRATVMINGEPVAHGLGGGQLRIDVPLPPKAAEPTPAPAPEVAQAPAPPAEKRLTRLEKLRLERKQP